jgi:hypothetical protein
VRVCLRLSPHATLAVLWLSCVLTAPALCRALHRTPLGVGVGLASSLERLVVTLDSPSLPAGSKAPQLQLVAKFPPSDPEARMPCEPP